MAVPPTNTTIFSSFELLWRSEIVQWHSVAIGRGVEKNTRNDDDDDDDDEEEEG